MYSCTLLICKPILTIFLLLTFIIYTINPTNPEINPFELSIVHFSDFHSRFVPISPQGGLCYDYDKEKCVGGIARVAAMSKKLKAEWPNALFLNAGDNFQGTLYYELFRGNITAQFLNLLPQDAMTIGNHDFDDSISGLESFLRNLKAPVVDANIDVSGEPSLKGLFTSSIVVQKGDKKIGIIGAIFSDTDKLSSTTGNVKFLEEIDTISKEAAKLKLDGVSIIIVLSHCGIERDKSIAKNCPEIDVIVGGHSHVILYNGKPPSGDVAYGPYPIVIDQSESNRKVLIVHSGPFTKYIGGIRILFDEKGEVIQWEGNPIYLNKSIPEDETVLEQLKPWKEAVEKIGKEQIGSAAVFMNISDCYSGDCNLAYLVTDAMVDYYSKYSPIGLNTSINIQNSIPAGPIFYEDIYACLPYNNTWNLIEMRGKDLLKVLEENVAQGKSAGKVFMNIKLLHWSGMIVKYNLQNKESKVVDVKIRCNGCSEEKDYEDLEKSKFYKIVVPTYLLTEDFKTISKNHKLIHPGAIRDFNLLIGYIKRIKKVDFKNESRMIFVG